MSRRTRRPTRTLLIALAIAVVVVARGVAWQAAPSSGAPEQARFGTRTEAVLVDVSVTDRRGRPVTDLEPKEFQVFEDGILQTILSVDRHQPNPAATVEDAATAAGLAPAAGHAAGGVTSGRGPAIVALAFDRLSPEGRQLAVQAAKQFIAEKQPDELAGVFVVDEMLATVAPYTTDRVRLGAAIDRISTTPGTAFARERNPMLQSYTSSPDVPWVAGAEEKGRSAGDLPWVDPVAQAASAGDHATVAKLQVLMRMERSYQDLLYEMQGQASINALLALVDSLGAIEGRKSLLYFCEGLTIPPSVEPRYRAIIDTANRRNVTVYSLDAAGLRVQSKQAETAMGVIEVGAKGIGDRPHDEKYLSSLEDNERFLKLDPAVSLGILAEQTGGLLINNTNDLARGVRRIDEDRRNYYLLSYTPTNQVEDGTFRKLSVIVSRPGVEVRARTGYRATPRSDAGPVLPYETPALAALAMNPAPAAIAADIGAYSVPMPGRPGLTAIVANIPGSSLSFLSNDVAKTFSGEVVVLAQVRGDATGLPRKLSQQYALSGDMAHLAETRTRRILFLRTPDLSPGEHAIEVAVHDGPAKRDRVFRTTVRVPEGGRPVVGDLMMIDHAEPIEPGANLAGNPFVADALALIPTLAPTISRSARPEVNFALSMVLDPTQPLPDATLSLDLEGTPMSTVALPLKAPDAQGRLLAVGRVPIGAIPPGHYQLQVTIGSGADVQVRRAALTVTN